MIEGIVVRRNHSGPTVRRYVWSTALEDARSPGILVLGSATDFEEFFGPLYPLLSEYRWLVKNAVFAIPSAWEQWYDVALDRPRGPELDEYFGYQVAVWNAHAPAWLWLARPGFLPRYAKYLVDDWCQLAGVTAWSGDPQELLRLAEAEQVALWKLPMVEVCFRTLMQRYGSLPRRIMA